MKILLLGANGQVGFELQRALAPLGGLVAATRRGILPGGAACEVADLDRPESLVALLERTQPAVIVNAAAYTAVDRAEDEPAAALRANGEAPGVLGRWAAANDAVVVHYSTDYVFGGNATAAYHEDDERAPLGVYASSKLAGENALRDSGAVHLIFRTAWVYAARGSNFLRTMLRLAGERDRLTVVADQFGAPTSARLIASTTAAVLSRWLAVDATQRLQSSGVYHLVSGGHCSWHDFANAIFTRATRAELIERAPEVVAISTAEFPTRARRPAWSVLDTARLRETFSVQLPNWQDGLDDVIGELAKK
ncbi:MAG: dTDP-4-dehydrorhamnose reductase [Tahibacter sp.]